MKATIQFTLSQSGQRAALKAGFNGRQRMRRDIEVAPEQVDLFYVTPDGELEYPSGAISREGSTYALNADFDNVPTDAELLAAVEAERVKQAAENAARERSHREHQERQRAAETERAVKAVEGYRAWMALPESERVYWDAYPRVRGDCDFDSGVLPERERTEYLAERKRLFDLLQEQHDREVAEAKAAEEAAKLAKAEFRTQFIREHGTDNQRERLEAELLSDDEIMNAMRDHVFAPLKEFDRYQKLTGSDIGHEEGCGGSAYSANDAETLTAEQWDVVKRIKTAMPQASVTARRHRGWCDADCSASVTRYGALVKQAFGPFTLAREFAIPDLSE